MHLLDYYTESAITQVPVIAFYTIDAVTRYYIY